MDRKNNLRAWQIKIFVLCWVAYTCVYLGRLNLSISIPAMQEVGFTKGQLGLISSAFFWVYGIGQLVNGCLGDKISCRIFVFLGLVVTGITNILFGFTTSVFIMIVLWCFNGYFQSMLWGPIVKTLSYWFSYEKRSDVAIWISTSQIVGYLVVWGAMLPLLSLVKWQWSFWVPGIVALGFAIIWVMYIRNHPKEVGMESPNKVIEQSEKENGANYTLWEIIKEAKLWLIVIACVTQGIIKDGISLWAPTFMMENFSLNVGSTTLMIILIPITNFIAMIMAGKLNRKLKNKECMTTGILFVIGLISILGLIVFKEGPIVALIFLCVSSSAMFAANTVLLGVIPMNYVKYGKTSSIVGFLNFTAYMASGFATAITGIIIDSFGWGGVLKMWIVLAIIGVLALIMDSKKSTFESNSEII